jgi:hypothetical protein
VLPANVAAAMQGVPGSLGAPVGINPVTPSNTGQEVNVTVMSAIIIWDPSARNRPGESGMIMYQNVAGIGNGMRPLTPQENAQPFISAALQISSNSFEFQEKLNDSRPTTLSGGFRSQTPFNNNDGESRVNISVYTPTIALNPVFPANGSNLPLGSLTQADRQAISRVASLLNNNPASSITILGNANAPAGSTPATMNSTAGITFGNLTMNRANAIRDIFTSIPYNVNAAQINTGTGNVTSGNTNVTVVPTGTGGTPPNNGNRIDFVP